MNKLYALVAMIVVCILAMTAQKFTINKKETEILRIKDEMIELNGKNAVCNAFLENQNIKIKSLELKKQQSKPLAEVERVKKITIKDSSCQSELKAYKELFGKDEK